MRVNLYHDLYHPIKITLRRLIKHNNFKVSCFAWYKQSNWKISLYIHDMGSVSWPILWLYLTPRYISVKGGQVRDGVWKGFPWLIYLHSYINNKNVFYNNNFISTRYTHVKLPITFHNSNKKIILNIILNNLTQHVLINLWRKEPPVLSSIVLHLMDASQI